MDHQNNGSDQPKHISTRVNPILHQLDMSMPDFPLAIALQQQQQQQERAFTTPFTMESDEDDENNDENTNGYEFYEGSEFEAELEFLVEEESDIEEYDMDFEEEDEIDVDELSYEELIAIGEFIGVEKRGLSLEEISSCLRPCEIRSIIEGGDGIDRCVICQMEYGEEEGDQNEVVALNCNHPYHQDCITNWLRDKKSCPICNTEVSPS